MNTYTITLAANVRAYARVEIEAEDEAAAIKQGDAIAAALNKDEYAAAEAIALSFETVFDPEYDTLMDCEMIDVQPSEVLREVIARSEP